MIRKIKIITLAISIMAGVILFSAGCQTDTGPTAEDKLLVAWRDIARQEEDLAELRQTLAERERVIDTLQGLGGKKRLANLFTVTEIEMHRFTGGVNLDDKVGDDGLRVRFSPLDESGTALKASGDVIIKLFDLSADNDDTLIAEYKFSASEIGKHWAGHLGAYHFTFECPFPEGKAVSSDEVTVRVEFIDYLTGKTFTGQKLCKIKLGNE